jgi:alpha-tubulin suppressor-like RCC1 family protein
VTRCWGDGSYGQLGDGTLTGSTSPSTVLGGLDFATALAAGSHFTCGTTLQSGVYCWGAADTAQLGGGFGGDGLLSAVPTPLAVP